MDTLTFDTALGEFGIGWTEAGIARLQLPGLQHDDLLERINRNGAQTGEATRTIEAVINRIEDYAEGAESDFRIYRLILRACRISTGAPMLCC